MEGEVKKARLELRRGSRGIIVNVIADKSVEEFFANWSRGATRPLSDYSRNWRSVGEEKILNVYTIPEVAMPADIQLFKIGNGLVLDSYDGERDRRTQQVNLSFLRIQGISSGIEFSIAEVMDKDGIHRAFQALTKGMDTFYRQYLAPVKYTLELIAREG